jgi:hypothetical protein
MAIEIVDFPINSMVIFHSYVNVYQRVPGLVNIKKNDGKIPHVFFGKKLTISEFSMAMFNSYFDITRG